MNANMEERLARFVADRDRMKKAFAWESGMTHALCALIDTEAARETDADAIRRAKQAMKRYAGAFSPLRGYPLLAVCTAASAQPDPDAYLKSVNETYRVYRAAGFPSSYFVAIAAFSAALLPSGVVPEDAFSLYRAMRGAHAWIGSQEDAVSAVLLASLGEAQETLLNRCEDAYAILSDGIGSHFGCWQLSKCLAMSAEPAADSAARALRLYEALKARGVKTGKGRELSALALPALSGLDPLLAADQIEAVNAYLSGQKGFSAWTMAKPIRTLFASALAGMEWTSAPGAVLQNAAITSSVTAALIAATTAAIAASTSASAAAASSN